MRFRVPCENEEIDSGNLVKDRPEVHAEGFPPRIMHDEGRHRERQHGEVVDTPFELFSYQL